MNAPIRIRLTALHIVTLAAILAALIAFVVTRLRADLTAALDRGLRDAAGQIAHGYGAEGPAEFFDTAGTVLPGDRGEAGGAEIVSPSGRVVLAQGVLRVSPASIGAGVRREVLSGRPLSLSVRLGSPARHLRLIVTSVQRRRHRQVLAVAESLREVDSAAHRALVLLLLGGAGALALVALVGWWIARRALAPVQRMTSRAAAIGSDDLSQRIPVGEVRDELAGLASTLNAMLDRIQDGVHAREQLLHRLHDEVLARQRLVADASHELRSPLAAMRTELDVTLRQADLDPAARAALQLTRDDSVRLGSIVDNLLTLARVDEGRLELLTAPRDLRDLGERALRSHQHAASTRHVRVELVPGPPVIADVDRDRIEQVIGNLIDNAIRHSPAGETITLTISEADGAAQIEVTDAGPGIPADQRERVFERFSRQDPARPRGGAGLGLAICREVTRAHDGTISIEDHDPIGTTMRIALPLAPRAAAPARTGA